MRRALTAVAAAAACIAGTLTMPAPPQQAEAAIPDTAAGPAQAFEAIVGSGSSYAAEAINDWKAYAGARGWDVSYTPTNSVAGLGGYDQGLNDYAATEAEFTSLGSAGGRVEPARGAQYTPTVAGAIAIAYNVNDQAGNDVRTLKLSRETIARIFIGEISNWSHPAITADNDNRKLPNQDIRVVYRSGFSGTTALFYDFVQNTVPAEFNAWAGRNGFSTTVRIIQVDTSPRFVPHGRPASGSDSMVTELSGNNGEWSITAVEASYAIKANVGVAYVQNQSGNWVQPSAASITSALEGAGLRGDISQDLAPVYVSPPADAYPISAYSYLVTQCEAGQGPDCKGRYTRPGKEALLAEWMRYIACDGQAEMGRGVQGFAPLPPHLSQEIANSIGRMRGAPPETLTRTNCGNPRFDPNFQLPRGAPPPPPPADSVADGGQETDGSENPSGTTATTAAAANETAAAGLAGGDAVAVGGGSTNWRDAEPTSYDRPGMSPLEIWTWVVVVAVLVVPLAFGIVWGLLRRTRV